jgi:hypothetical protein
MRRKDIVSETNPHPSPFPSQRTENTVYPLSYAQQALWFLYKLAPEEATYNMGFSARICSALDTDAFKRAFQELIQRHSAFRTTFFEHSGIPMQEVHGDRELQIEQVDASTWDERQLHEQVMEAYRKPFDLTNGPVLRVLLFTKSQTEHVFLLAVHHIVFDSTSLWVLLNELRDLPSAARRIWKLYKVGKRSGRRPGRCPRLGILENAIGRGTAGVEFANGSATSSAPNQQGSLPPFHSRKGPDAKVEVGSPGRRDNPLHSPSGGVPGIAASILRPGRFSHWLVRKQP